MLTPEEWVRQHFISFLIKQKKYPGSLISIEKGMKVNTRSKRTDIVIYSPQGFPWMIVECKSPVMSITREALYQAVRYNLALKVPYLTLTNGLEHYTYKTENNNIVLLDNLPCYEARCAVG